MIDHPPTPRKRCFKCGEVKALRLFYRHPRMRDGHLNKCNECARSDVNVNRARNLDRYRAYDRARGCRETDPQKTSARQKVHLALLRGELARKPCETCGSSGADAHHDDYSQPLSVVWLCRSHHMRRHSRLEESAQPPSDVNENMRDEL